MPCALRLVLGHSNLSGQVINLYALNADFCGLGTRAKSVWHVTEMRARGQSVPRSITPFSTLLCDGNTLSAQVLESALNMQWQRWERGRGRETFALRNPTEVSPPSPRHIKLRAGLGPTTCKAAQKLQIRCFFGFFNFLLSFFLVTLRSEIKFMTRQLVKENHTLSSSSCQDFIKLLPAKAKTAKLAQSAKG